MLTAKAAVAAVSRPEVAASVSIPSALISWFAATLPAVQWFAGAVAIVVGGLAIYRHFRRGS